MVTYWIRCILYFNIDKCVCIWKRKHEICISLKGGPSAFLCLLSAQSLALVPHSVLLSFTVLHLLLFFLGVILMKAGHAFLFTDPPSASMRSENQRVSDHPVSRCWMDLDEQNRAALFRSTFRCTGAAESTALPTTAHKKQTQAQCHVRHKHNPRKPGSEEL